MNTVLRRLTIAGMATEFETVSARLDPEHVALLDACCEAERLRRTDIIRRALRHYAEHLGVAQAKPKRSAKR